MAEEKQIIATHSGKFHADEVVACWMLKRKFKQAEIVRTRDEKIIEKAYIVVDVGKNYNHEKKRYDHHQYDPNKEKLDLKFEMDNPNCLIPLSSCGLIFKHYGVDFLSTIVDITKIKDMKKFLNLLYYNVFQEIDAIDNGILSTKEKPKYRVNGISAMITMFNSVEKKDDSIKQQSNFQLAMDFAESVLTLSIKHYYHYILSFEENYQYFEKKLNERKSDYIIVENICDEWQDCIRKYEEEHIDKSKLNFIIYFFDNEWKIRVIQERFVNRISLLSEEELKQIWNLNENTKKFIPKLHFVHKAKFIGTAEDLDTIMEVMKLTKEKTKK
jgi:uncharacterized UPF0160 family protein